MSVELGKLVSGFLLGTVTSMSLWAVAPDSILAQVDCLSLSNPQWNNACYREQNWSDYELTPHYFWVPTESTKFRWKIYRRDFAAIHGQNGTGPSETALSHYPVRAAKEATGLWDNSSNVSKLSLDEGGDHYVIGAMAAADFMTRQATLDFGHAAAITAFGKHSTSCGDGAYGALVKCYKQAATVFNGGYGWLPQNNAYPTTVCLQITSRLRAIPQPTPDGNCPGWWGIAPIEGAMVHEVGHAIGLAHYISGGLGCPPFTESVQEKIGEGSSPSLASTRPPSADDRRAARFLYGKP